MEELRQELHRSKLKQRKAERAAKWAHAQLLRMCKQLPESALCVVPGYYPDSGRPRDDSVLGMGAIAEGRHHRPARGPPGRRSRCNSQGKGKSRPSRSLEQDGYASDGHAHRDEAHHAKAPRTPPLNRTMHHIRRDELLRSISFSL